MPLISRPAASPDTALTVPPFFRYAQLVRLLVPGVAKQCFYDPECRPLWVSDGIEEPELRRRVELLAARTLDDNNEPAPPADGEDATLRVLPVRNAADEVQGFLAVVLNTLPSSASYRRAGTLERLLAPLVEILAHDWSLSREPVPRWLNVAPETDTVASRRASIVGPASRMTAAPAVLRRTLSLAASNTACAFAGLVATRRALTLTHRISAQESQLDQHGIIDALRQQMLHLVQDRSDPVSVSSIDPPGAAGVRYKFMVCPVRTYGGDLVAILALFRQRHEPDFDAADRHALLRVAVQIPADILEELARAGHEPAAPPVERAATVAEQPNVIELPMDRRVRTALRTNGFVLYAQHIAPLRERPGPARHEVLLRMKDGSTLHLPQVFFASAAEHNLLADVDRWVIGNLVKSLRGAATELEFTVNVSAQSLRQETFADSIQAHLVRSSLPTRGLVFEFTEQLVLEQQDAFLRMAQRLHDLGCRVALDNCRQGLDVFKLVQRSPISCLKIDAMLTRQLVRDERAARVVREIAEVASDIGIETVAECVEDAHTYARLRELPVDFAQGFHLSEPIPLVDVLK